MPLLTGPELDKFIQTYLNPFVIKNGRAIGIKPTEERPYSINSNNANNPLWQEQAKGIALAHADKENPTVGGLALSYNSSRRGGAKNATQNIIEGAKMSYDQLVSWVEAYNLKGLALFIDHFTGPDREDALKNGPDPKPHISRNEARGRIINSLEFLINKNLDYIERWGKKQDKQIIWNDTDYDFREDTLAKVRMNPDTTEKSVDFYLSKDFQEFRRVCLGVAKVIPGAASFMVELGAYSPWENIALSKDIFDGIKAIQPDILVEVSIVDTGEKREYFYLRPELGEPEKFSDVSVAIVEGTGADKVSYPGGATHALDISAEKRGIDIPKVTAAQMALYNASGKVIPIAWHGGTSLYPWSEIDVIRRLREKIRGYEDVPAAINPAFIEYICEEKKEAVLNLLQNPEIAPGTSPKEWRGLVTQININTTYLAMAMAGTFDYGLEHFVDMVTMGKKAGGFPNQAIEWVRQSAVNNAIVSASYGKSPFGGGVDIGALKEYHIVAPTAIRKTSD